MPKFTLYHFASCPFCIRVRQVIDELGINIEQRDTLLNPAYRQELLEGGGSSTVPCLKIEEKGQTRWQYESADIIQYLRDLENA